MSHLLPGENMILTEHPHWVTMVKGLVIPFLLLVVVALADLTILGPSIAYTPHLRTYLSLGALAIALLWLIVAWIRWRSTAYTLTDQRITIATGVFGRQEKVIPVDRIQDCTTKVSVFGRMLGYGRVEIDAAGAQGAEVLDHLPSPGTFRDRVFVQSEKRRGGGAPSAPRVPANPSGV